MSWEMQVKVRKMENNKSMLKWASVKPSDKNAEPYRYPTERAAMYSLNSCYPLVENEKKRVIEVEEPANIGLGESTRTATT